MSGDPVEGKGGVGFYVIGDGAVNYSVGGNEVGVGASHCKDRVKSRFRAGHRERLLNGGRGRAAVPPARD